jgi:hypothetical protein
LFGYGKQTNGVTAVLFVYGDVMAKAFISSALTTSKASSFPALLPKAVTVASFGVSYLAYVSSHG